MRTPGAAAPLATRKRLLPRGVARCVVGRAPMHAASSRARARNTNMPPRVTSVVRARTAGVCRWSLDSLGPSPSWLHCVHTVRQDMCVVRCLALRNEFCFHYFRVFVFFCLAQLTTTSPDLLLPSPSSIGLGYTVAPSLLCRRTSARRVELCYCYDLGAFFWPNCPRGQFCRDGALSLQILPWLYSGTEVRFSRRSAWRI